MSSKTTKRKRAASSAPEASEATPDRSPSAASAGAQERPPATPVAAVASVAPAAAVESAPAVVPVADATEHGPTVGLASNHTIKDAAVLKDSLLQVFDEPGDVAIDAKSVERIDTAVMQLLCAFVRDRAARGHTVSFSRPTRAFSDAAKLLGVSSLLALPAVDAGVAK